MYSFTTATLRYALFTVLYIYAAILDFLLLQVMDTAFADIVSTRNRFDYSEKYLLRFCGTQLIPDG